MLLHLSVVIKPVTANINIDDSFKRQGRNNLKSLKDKWSRRAEEKNILTHPINASRCRAHRNLVVSLDKRLTVEVTMQGVTADKSQVDI